MQTTKNKFFIFSAIIALALLSACATDTKSVPLKTPEQPAIQATAELTANEFFVDNPASAAKLYVKLVLPADYVTGALPTIVLIPGGNGDSSNFLKTGPRGAQNLADDGFAVLVFDPDGRGKSSGREDYNGFIHQDGLKAIIELAAGLPQVDPDKIGIASYSYGITMASGALARYPDLPVKFLFDFEGPADRNDTGGCDASKLGHLKDTASCDDETFWAEHEASTFIGGIKVPYWRIQTKKDHVQPDYNHTIVMINAALAGGVPAVYLNDSQISAALDAAKLPKMLPDVFDIQYMEIIAKRALELLP